MTTNKLSLMNRRATFSGAEIFPLVADGKNWRGDVDTFAGFIAPRVPVSEEVAGVAEQVFAARDSVLPVGDRFIGISANPPTTRKDGSSLVVGDIYSNTQSPSTSFQWNGNTWIAIADPANATQVSFIADVDGAQPRDMQSKGRDQRSITDLPVNVQGLFDIGPFMQRAASKGGRWSFPAGRYLLDSAVTFDKDNCFFDADPDAELIVTANAKLLFNARKCGWRGGKITSTITDISGTGIFWNWATTSEDCYVEDTFVSGNYGAFFQPQGLRPRVNGNSFDPNGVVCVTPIQLMNAVNPQIIGNKMKEYDGFGIIGRQDVVGGWIAYNHINPSVWTGEIIATAGQTVFTYDFGNPRVKRFGLVADGKRVSYSYSQAGSSVTFTLTAGLTAGAVVKVFAWASLENINVNLRSKDTLVFANICENSGDGGIVVTDGSSSSGTAVDFLHGIKVIGNTVIKSAASGIGIGGTFGAVVNANVVRDCGFNLASPTTMAQTSSLFMSAIYLPKQPGSVCSGNVVEVNDGYTQYGVAFSLGGDTTFLSDRDRRHSVGANKIVGVKRSRYWAFADSSATSRQIGVDVFDLDWREYPENIIDTLVVNWSGTSSTRPPDSPYWTGSSVGGGIQRNTVENLMAPACIATIAGGSNDFVPRFLQRLTYSFVRLTFRAHAAAGNSGYVSMFTRPSSDTDSSPGCTVNITDTIDRVYEIVMSVETLNNFIIRVGGASSNGVVYITEMRLQYGPIGFVDN
ncbi:hypothetical protein NUV26_21300 [Burkholderia pseudomultivorans]|uniref:hypothetical protein n=1 Tax=Burkholderia pseudomultivorans TaxID=1207504 RepID=UPI002875AF33|nr:hypothetical protein [Burkholderia pseudomultivorans]MDS0794709.1 hypothetical protein [Burkholderia pseudomultivorans]